MAVFLFDSLAEEWEEATISTTFEIPIDEDSVGTSMTAEKTSDILIAAWYEAIWPRNFKHSIENSNGLSEYEAVVGLASSTTALSNTVSTGAARNTVADQKNQTH